MPSSFFDAIDDLPTATDIPDMAKLLSASSYPTAPTDRLSPRNANRQLYGGFMPANDSADEDQEEDDHQPRKRSKFTQPNSGKSNDNANDIPKRQRGRPKVSTKDETAAERRRTQIRLAQRAYRNRKENTITELTQKVESLQATVKNLNVGFARLRENLLNTGLVHANSTMARQVDDLMRQLTEALESPPSDVDKSSGDDDDEQRDQEFIQEAEQDQFNMFDGHTAPMPSQGQPNPTSLKPASDLSSNSLGVGAEHSILDLEGQILTDFQTYPTSPTTFLTSSAFSTSAAQFPDPPLSSNEPLASMSIDRFPHKHSYTYSFQETTFARRLHRLCIERAYQRLMSPHVDPDWILKAFKFTLNFTNKERIIRAFRQILARGTDEPLENWRSPFIYIGGAGLHFPRRDPHGRPVYPPNLLHPARSAGTFRLPNTETTPVGDTYQEILDSVGYGGEWFDSHDVEEYLKTKGIYPDAQSSFVTVDIALTGFTLPPGSDTIGTLTTGSSPQSHNTSQSHPHPSTEVFHSIENVDHHTSLLKTVPEIPTSIDKWLGQQEMFHQNDFDVEIQRPATAVAQGESRVLTIEIERFLERLSDQTVCLGRAPGFRKEHVDNALMLAMQEAF